MSRLTRDGTAEHVSRDQILRHVRGQENICFLCSADHEQDWQPYPVDPYSAIICDDHIVRRKYNEITQGAYNKDNKNNRYPEGHHSTYPRASRRYAGLGPSPGRT